MADGRSDAKDIGTGASLEELGAFYDRLRSYTQHQDDLINQRLTWYLTLQGFMFTAFVLSLQKQIDVISGTGRDLSMNRTGSSLILLGFGVILALTSVAISLTVRRSITAAVEALSCLRHTWESLIHDYGGIEHSYTPEGRKYIKPLLGRLPFLHGGGNDSNIARGPHSALAITRYILIAWILIAIGYVAVWTSVMGFNIEVFKGYIMPHIHKIFG